MIKITTGIDLTNVERFRKISFKEKNRFYKKIFDLDEIKYCTRFKDPYPHFAGKFALKESFLKATHKSIPFIEIHTKHGYKGEPIIECSKVKFKFLTASVSHEKHYAVANVVIIW